MYTTLLSYFILCVYSILYCFIIVFYIMCCMYVYIYICDYLYLYSYFYSYFYSYLYSYVRMYVFIGIRSIDIRRLMLLRSQSYLIPVISRNRWIGHALNQPSTA